jgi:hypothetical protein
MPTMARTATGTRMPAITPTTRGHGHPILCIPPMVPGAGPADARVTATWSTAPEGTPTRVRLCESVSLRLVQREDSDAHDRWTRARRSRTRDRSRALVIAGVAGDEDVGAVVDQAGVGAAGHVGDPVFDGVGLFFPDAAASDADDVVVVFGAAAAVHELAVDDEGVQDAGVGQGAEGPVDGGQGDRGCRDRAGVGAGPARRSAVGVCRAGAGRPGGRGWGPDRGGRAGRRRRPGRRRGWSAGIG